MGRLGEGESSVPVVESIATMATMATTDSMKTKKAMNAMKAMKNTKTTKTMKAMKARSTILATIPDLGPGGLLTPAHTSPLPPNTLGREEEVQGEVVVLGEVEEQCRGWWRTGEHRRPLHMPPPAPPSRPLLPSFPAPSRLPLLRTSPDLVHLSSSSEESEEEEGVSRGGGRETEVPSGLAEGPLASLWSGEVREGVR